MVADRSRESTRGERIGQSGVVWPEESVSLPRRAAGGGGRDEPLASDSGGLGGRFRDGSVEPWRGKREEWSGVRVPIYPPIAERV